MGSLLGPPPAGPHAQTLLTRNLAAVCRSDAAQEADLIPPELRPYRHDPLGYVRDRFPWGREGPLAKFQGPEEWQRDLLRDLGAGLASANETIQRAVSSGHGVGKSALVAWVILWALETLVDTRGVVTANTETQLRTKTWPELAKWHRLGHVGERFVYTATSLYSRAPGHEKNWRVDLIPWNAKNPEAFAGLHNQGRRILLVFDEASAIVDEIWETSEGALTDIDTEIIWLAFGNATRASGRFRRTLGADAHRWHPRQVDSRSVSVANKKQIEKWLEDYDEDSDFIRVRVRGLPPRASDLQFIPSDWVAAARKREAVSAPSDPLILAIDVARGGSDNNVLAWRRGLDARSARKWQRIPGELTRDTMRLVTAIVQAIQDAEMGKVPEEVTCFLDATGMGGPIVDRCRQLGYNVIEVQFGGGAQDAHYANKRAEMWGRMREWLKFGAIPDDDDLEEQLTTIESHHNKRDQLVLESKEDLKARGLKSPDDGDALALTFAYPVAPRSQLPGQPLVRHEYDPYA